MSNAILEMVYPARGGGVTNGNFETVFGAEWTGLPADRCIVYHDGTMYLDGSYCIRIRQDKPNKGYINATQVISNLDYYAGKCVTFMARVRSTRPKCLVGMEVNGIEYYSQESNLGLGGDNWEYSRLSMILDDSLTSLKLILYFDSAKWPPTWIRWDCASLVLGDTYSRIEIDKCHVFPEANPEQVPSGAVTLADGSIAGVEDSLVIINKEYMFKGITDIQYKKLRNFQRYICCGLTYEFDYTDIDGVAYKARMMPSFLDATRIAPDRWNTTMNLRLTDKGIA